MARLSRKQQQDKRELLSSLNHVNNCIGSKHAAENRKLYLNIIHSKNHSNNMHCKNRKKSQELPGN